MQETCGVENVSEENRVLPVKKIGTVWGTDTNALQGAGSCALPPLAIRKCCTTRTTCLSNVRLHTDLFPE